MKRRSTETYGERGEGMEDGSLTTAGLVSYFLIEGSIRTWVEVRSNGIVFGGVGFKVGCHGIGMGGGGLGGGPKKPDHWTYLS